MSTQPERADESSPVLVGIGELLWDCFEDGRRPGGAPANVAYHANQLGLRGLVASRVGTDNLGEELSAFLRAQGLDTRLIQRDPGHATSTVDVHHARTGPAYTIHEDVAWDYLDMPAELVATIDGCAAVCFGTLAQRSTTSRLTIQQCVERARHAWRIYDVNLRPPFFDRAWIEPSLRLCRVVKLNHEELPQIGELLGLASESPPELAAGLRSQFDIELVCVTRGGGGCALYAVDETVDVPGAHVVVADTVGAGDAFTAALSAGLVWGWPLHAIGPFANGVGGLVATRQGAMPEIRAELAALVAKHRP